MPKKWNVTCADADIGIERRWRQEDGDRETEF